MTSISVEGTARVNASRFVNGVFSGGGAKSIAYVGALRALRDRGLWFGGVAGSSAGAIASALIASGMSPEQLELALPKALAAARSPIASRVGLAVLGKATSLFEGAGLQRWLDQQLREQIGREDGRPVTFGQLHDATCIELYVLALDLATGLPVVFCRRTTPDVEVAGAVVASSAIPGAFPAGRAVFKGDGTGARVHQLIDGGGWANLPSFVFQDRSFRAWLRGESQLEHEWSEHDDTSWSAETDRPLMGFVLGDAEPQQFSNSMGFVPLDGPDVDRRFDLGPSYTSRKRLMYLVGSILSSDWARLAIGIALVVWVTSSLVTMPIAFRRFSTALAEWMPDPLYPFVLVGSLTVAVLAVVVAICVIALLMLASRVLADTLLPAIKIVLGVPSEVPPWIGQGDDSIVIRVPDDGLETIEFDIAPELIAQVIEAAEGSVGKQLDDPAAAARRGALFAGLDPDPVPYRRGERSPEPPPGAAPSAVMAMGVLVAVTVAIGMLAWWATNSAGSSGIVRITLGVVSSSIAALFAFRYIGARSGRRAHARATSGVGNTIATPRPSPWVTFSVGCALLLGGAVLSIVAMDAREAHTSSAEVVSAQGAATEAQPNTYLVDVDGVDALASVSTSRHLRLGAKVFVRPNSDGSSYRLVGALDDWRFGAAVVLWALAFGAFVSASRTRRWITRCRRLDTLVSTWATG